MDYQTMPLYEGASQGLGSFADAIDKYTEQHKKDVANGKIAESLVKTNPEILQGMGTTIEEFQNQSPRDKMNAVLGYTQANAIKQYQAHTAALESETATRRQQLAERLRTKADEDRFNADIYGAMNPAGAAAANPAAMAPLSIGAGGYPIMGMISAGAQQPGAVQALSPSAVMGYMARNNVIGNPNIDHVLNTLERYRDASAAGAAPQVHQLPGGYVGFTLPGSKNLSIHPDLSKTPNMIDLTDENGNPTGVRGYYDGRGFRIIKPQPDVGAAPEVAEIGGKKFYKTPAGWKAIPETFIESIQKLGSTGENKTTSAAYKSKDDVVNAFKSGKLSRDEAAAILNKQFGVPHQ